MLASAAQALFALFLGVVGVVALLAALLGVAFGLCYLIYSVHPATRDERSQQRIDREFSALIATWNRET